MQYLTRSILAATLTFTLASPVLAKPKGGSHGPPGPPSHSMRDFGHSRGLKKGHYKNKKAVRYDRIDYGRDRRDWDYEMARRERMARMERARIIRMERERMARIERARRERLARLERERRERDRIYRTSRNECYENDRGRVYDRNRDGRSGNRADVLRERVADILRSGHENDRCRDRRDDRRVVTRDPRNWPDSRDRDWPDTRSNWPVPTYPRYATQANTTAQVIAQRALEILRAAP